MPKFNFTYAREAGYPFEGGWTEVEAPSLRVAMQLIDCFHSGRNMEREPFEYILTEEEATKSGMLDAGYQGAKCQESIRVVREVFADMEVNQ